MHVQLSDSQTREKYPKQLIVFVSSLCEILVPNSSRSLIQQWHVTLLPECEFGFEHSLSLQPCALSDEQVVVVSLERSFVNVKHFIPQVEGHAVARKRKKF